MFNKIQNITDRRITGAFENLESLVNYIKSPDRPEVKNILKAREIGKGTEEYRKIKTSAIPCAPINFNHNEYVKSSTITNPTGYIYLDIDDEDSLGDIDLNYVAAYWKSLSNTGYSVIVKADGLSHENLKDAYNQIGDLLDIRYDSAAISKDRLTVLSYDPEAYFNTDYNEIQLEGKKETHYSIIENTLSLCYDYNGSIIRYNNLEEIIIRSNIQPSYDENGIYDFGSNSKIQFSKVIIPFQNIKEGRRNTIMTSIIHQLVALNPNCPREKLFQLSHYINNDRMSPPLPKKVISEAFGTKYAAKETLKPILNASKRFLYDEQLNLTAYQKRCLTAKKIGADRVEKSKKKIRGVLSNWDYEKMGKITNKKVASVTGMNIKTVNKYCSKLRKELSL